MRTHILSVYLRQEKKHYPLTGSFASPDNILATTDDLTQQCYASTVNGVCYLCVDRCVPPSETDIPGPLHGFRLLDRAQSAFFSELPRPVGFPEAALTCDSLLPCRDLGSRPEAVTRYHDLGRDWDLSCRLCLLLFSRLFICSVQN